MLDNMFSSFDSLIFEPDKIMEQAANLGLYGAIVSVITGIIYMMYGWRIFRVMVAILFAFIGFYAGMYIGDFFGWATFGGVILAVLFAIASLPLMKLATCFIIALVSSALAGYFWHISDMPEKYTLACAAVGLILGGLCGFYILRFAVMLYTSLLGASVVLTGFYGFISAISQTQIEDTSEPVTEVSKLSQDIPLNVILAILTVIGLLIQLKIHGTAGKEVDKKS